MSWKRVLFLLGVLLLAFGAAPLGADEGADVKGGVEDIQDDINKAIDRGVLWLLQQQLTDGSWGQDAKRYPTGMTGLALYTVLKGGVPKDHPSVALGFRSLRSVEPHETYVLATQLFALGASEPKADRPRMERLASRLLAFERRGTWSYPLAHEGDGWADRDGLTDLSNAQFAVLGLYAAHKAGIPIPRKVVHGIIKRTQYQQEIPREVGGTYADGKPREAAGFAYRAPGQSGLGPATGSMTCAGITVLEVCRRLLGSKLTTKWAREIDTSIRHALTWLDERWSVKHNPGQEKSHKLYYLYGLERVGSLLGRENIGSHAWYAEGARELLALQKDGGEWGTASDTAFALLFLLRATKGEVVTGGRGVRTFVPTYVTGETSPLRIRAEGHSPMRVWITSIHPDATKRYGERGRVPFTRVEWSINERIEVTATQGAPPHGADEMHGAVLHFPRAGKFRIRARGFVDGPRARGVVTSTWLDVEVKLLVQPWAWDEADWMARDLRVLERTSATSSTFHVDFQGPHRAIDRHPDGYWVCQSKPPDPRPSIRVRFRKGIKANQIVLFPVARRDGGRNRFDRPKRFEILVNGKGKPILVEPSEDELRSTALRLPKPVKLKSIEVTIPERTKGQSWPGECGFREVTVETSAVAPPTFEAEGLGTFRLACETKGASIHFTLDGTVPTQNSPLYDGIVAWPGPTRLHAIAVLPDGSTSRLLIARVR